MTEPQKYRAKQGAFAGALAGVLVSQYAPLWGTAAQLAAEPWSTVRKTLIGMHAIPAALLCALAGYVVARVREE